MMRVVREVYVRDDIAWGGPGDEAGTPGTVQLSPTPYGKTYLMLDTNVVLHQMDMLETDVAPLRDVIVPGTVLEETRRRSAVAAKRLTALVHNPERRFVVFPNQHHSETYSARQAGESPNDYSDRLIRIAAAWYNARLAPSTLTCLLLTNDRGNAAAARAAGVPAKSVAEWVAPLAAQGFPTLAERAAAADAEVPGGEEGRGAGHRPRKYTDHWAPARVAAALQRGEVTQGTLRVSRDAWWRGTVLVPAAAAEAARGGEGRTSTPPPSAPGDSASELVAVAVGGRECLNRATQGDTVALRLFVEEGGGRGDTAAAAGPGAMTLPAKDQACLHQDAVEEEAEGGGGRREGRLRGEVVAILKRAWRPLAGSLELEGDVEEGGVFGKDGVDAGAAAAVSGGSTWAYFRPVDTSFPRIRIATRQQATLADKRIIVALDGWDAWSAWPRGHYVRTLGTIGDKATETAVVLAEHDIPPNEFSTAVLACLPPASWRITPENSAGRADLRHIDVCSIDPPGCKDIDDALHARVLTADEALAALAGDAAAGPTSRPPPGATLPPGVDEVWQLGVHIADVTHFVAAGSALDAEAAYRGNTTYLVERRLDMLPSLLTETLCSLNGAVDRFAFSVTWLVTPPPDLAILRVDFNKSIIHSRAAMTYEQAQAKLDDGADSSPLAGTVRRLAAVARVLRRRRQAAGALSLASPEVRFRLDADTADPMDVSAYTLRETNKVVEEFMLLANIAVARRISEAFPRYALLRRHPTPPASSFDRLVAAAGAVGVPLDVSSNAALSRSLDAAGLPADDRSGAAAAAAGDALSPAAVAAADHREALRRANFNKLLRIVATRCMMQAVYFPSGELQPPEYAHYGLATPIYTHFTSPIRRYADVVVHRLLAAAVGIAPLPAAYESKDALRGVTDTLNTRHVNSQHAGRASTALYTAIFFDRRVTFEPALVMRLRPGALTVLVPQYGIEATVHLVPDKHSPEGGTLPAAATPAQHGYLITNEDHLALDDVAHTLTYTGPALDPVPLPGAKGCPPPPPQHVDAAALQVKVFDCVTVAMFVRRGAHHRRDLVVKVVDPPFHALAPILPPPHDERQVHGSEAVRILTAAGVPPAAVHMAPGVAEGLPEAPLPPQPDTAQAPKRGSKRRRRSSKGSA